MWCDGDETRFAYLASNRGVSSSNRSEAHHQEDIGQALHAQTDWPVPQIGTSGLLQGIVVPERRTAKTQCGRLKGTEELDGGEHWKRVKRESGMYIIPIK